MKAKVHASCLIAAITIFIVVPPVEHVRVCSTDYAVVVRVIQIRFIHFVIHALTPHEAGSAPERERHSVRCLRHRHVLSHAGSTVRARRHA